VQDCATLLETIAGSDGIDDRQPYNWAHRSVKFGEEVKTHLDKIDELPLKGIKVGVLKEGFSDPGTNPNVAAASRAAIIKLEELGAEVEEISIPLHKDSGMIWSKCLRLLNFIYAHGVHNTYTNKY